LGAKTLVFAFELSFFAKTEVLAPNAKSPKHTIPYFLTTTVALGFTFSYPKNA
jgi:hypothetical protein